MFSNGEWVINVKTVGELINELKLLPGDMPVDQNDDGEGATIAILSDGGSDSHVLFGAGDLAARIENEINDAA